MNTTNYRPFKNGFPYKLLKYLYENGTSAGIDVQREIGLNAWAMQKGIIYHDRANKNFDQIVLSLVNKGLIKILPNDSYELTKTGKTFMNEYINER